MNNTDLNKTISWWEKTNNELSTTAKWIALFEAVNIVAEKAHDKGIPYDKVEYKPKAISEYIKSTQDIFHRKLLEEQYGVETFYSEDPDKDFESTVI